MSSGGDRQFDPAGAAEPRPQGALDLLVELVRDLPPRTADQIADFFRSAKSAPEATGQDSNRRVSGWIERLVPASQQDLAKKLTTAWSSDGAAGGDETLGVALAAASAMDMWHRHDQHVELVWTGPPLPGQALRRTDQVLLDLIDGAHERLVIVSFAAYQVPVLNEALMRATKGSSRNNLCSAPLGEEAGSRSAKRNRSTYSATGSKRGVGVDIVLESEAESQGKVRGEPVRALGPQLADKVAVWGWPLEERPRDARGRHGALHAKFALADDHDLLVSSANLTPDALELNLELGIRVQGGPLLMVLSEHVRRLMRDGVLREIACQEWP